MTPREKSDAIKAAIVAKLPTQIAIAAATGIPLGEVCDTLKAWEDAKRIHRIDQGPGWRWWQIVEAA